jgi:yecA family protein
MTEERQPSSGGRTALRAFLARRAKPGAIQSFNELHGFLFTIASAPELVSPSGWLPLVLGGEERQFRTTEEAERILGSIMDLYNKINEDVLADKVKLPEDCRFRDDLLSNLDEDAPISQWSRGFALGHTWLKESWDEFLPEEYCEDLGAFFLVLAFFASRPAAEDCATEAADEGVSLASLARGCRKEFHYAMATYARLGRSIYQALMEQPPEESVKVGRNDPCPCGSGRKFKKCCG